MRTSADITPPKGDGLWTLLQQRPNRALWQHELMLSKGVRRVTSYVITHDPSRLQFDDIDDAEAFFYSIED